MKKIIVALVFVFIVAAYFGYNYVMAAPKDILTSSADFNYNTNDFLVEFTNNMAESEKTYTDKVIAIEGVITEIEDRGVTIDDKVFCQLEDTKKLKIGSEIKVKGLFIGYDDVFELVKLDQGSILK